VNFTPKGTVRKRVWLKQWGPLFEPVFLRTVLVRENCRRKCELKEGFDLLRNLKYYACVPPERPLCIFCVPQGEFQEEFDKLNSSMDTGKGKRKATNEWIDQLQIEGQSNVEENEVVDDKTGRDLPTAFLVGIESKDPRERAANQGFGMDESLYELSQVKTAFSNVHYLVVYCTTLKEVAYTW
jgi:hypothetical protein